MKVAKPYVVADDMLTRIVQHIVTAVQPSKIVLFGSYAWGNPNESSDVDLFVVLSTANLPAYKRPRLIYRCLRDFMVPFDVMVMTKQEVEEKVGVASSLPYKVMQEGRVLYG